MADPLSVAGLVTGVISLGLQVAGGLSDYLDAVKGRTEELNSAKKQATEMKDSLSTIEDLFLQVESSWPASATMIKRHVKSCNTELSALHALLSELSQPASASSGIRLELAEQKKKLTYPFNRSGICRLEERLAKVNSALQTALQVVELNVSITAANQIRQVHDLVLSLSQSQGAGACLSLTVARESPERTARGGPVVALDSIETAMSLASKPSLLSTSMKTLDEYSTAHAPRYTRSRICSCRPSRKMSSHQSSWGYFSFSHGTSSTRRHLPDCPLSQIDSQTQTTKFTVEYNGLRKLFQTAFVFSFTNTQGAGGRSISPGFTYYPTVDRWTAPAFRLLDLASLLLCNDPLRDKAVFKTLQCCLNGIFVLYSRKKASPKDITSNGESLLHRVVDIALMLMFTHYSPTFVDLIFSIVTNLVACGVPVATYDYEGQTPFALSLKYQGGSDASRELAKLVLPAEPDIPLIVGTSKLWWGADPLGAILQDLKLAEASGCGPLSLAARAGDERLVQDLIKRYPQSLEEVDHFGHTPLHLAFNHPSCLRLILQASGLLLLDKSTYDLSPLECACRLGCRAAVRILLASGSRIRLWCIRNADESCIDDVLIGLKQRRDELKLLALENLTEAEASSFGLHENTVLDGNAFGVLRLMLKRGIDVPSHLYVDANDECSVYLWVGHHRWQLQVSHFDKLWALGFRDLDSYDQEGNVPLLAYVSTAEAVRWLIEHGANYWTPFSERSDSTGAMITAQVTPAHFVFWTIGECRWRDTTYAKNVETEQWIVEKLMQARVSDTCSCPCLVGGCTPLKAFFDRLRQDYEYLSLQELARQYMHSIQTFQTSFSGEDLIAALRHITFDALGLIHTCCNFRYIRIYEASPRTPEEVDEIHSEQSTLLTLFADLVVEFGRIAHEDRDGVPLILHDPEEFWMRRWLPRITETLDSLDGHDLTEEERSAAEAIGVVWRPQPARTVWKGPTITPEYVMKELEKILNE